MEGHQSRRGAAVVRSIWVESPDTLGRLESRQPTYTSSLVGPIERGTPSAPRADCVWRSSARHCATICADFAPLGSSIPPPGPLRGAKGEPSRPSVPSSGLVVVGVGPCVRRTWATTGTGGRPALALSQWGLRPQGARGKGAERPLPSGEIHHDPRPSGAHHCLKLGWDMRRSRPSIPRARKHIVPAAYEQVSGPTAMARLGAGRHEPPRPPPFPAPAFAQSLNSASSSATACAIWYRRHRASTSMTRYGARQGTRQFPKRVK